MRRRARRMQRLANRGIRRHGEGKTVSLRRVRSLGTRNASPFQVAGALAAAESAMVIDAPGLFGQVPEGLSFTFANHAQVYTVASDVEVAPDRTAAIAFDPSLSELVPDDTEVSFEDFVEYSFRAARSELIQDEVRDFADANLRRIHLSATNAPTTPREGDFVIDEGDPERVTQVRIVSPSGTPVVYSLTLGELTT